MHNVILLTLWAGVSYVLYKIIAAVIDTRRHAAAARRLGCQPAHSIKSIDPLGLQNLYRILKADREFRVPQYLKGRVDTACVDYDRSLTTFSNSFFGSIAYFTIEPKNIQAVLATQFKDFGLGERRNGNFATLLGHGIVRSIRNECWVMIVPLLNRRSFRAMGRIGNMRGRCSVHNLLGIRSAILNWRKNTCKI